jgi:redox-sensitive bicupin YhaK (pirin superfamily)
VIAGSAFGKTSPVGMLSEWLYAEVSLAAGASASVDRDPEERAIYVVEGEVEIARETFEGPRLLVFHPSGRIAVRATRPARLMFLGGAALEGHATSGGISCPRAGNESSKPKKIGRREDSRRCRAKQNSFRFPNPR